MAQAVRSARPLEFALNMALQHMAAYRRRPGRQDSADQRRRIRLGAMMPEPRNGESTLRNKFMLIFRGGAVARRDLSPSELQAHVEKWYRWSDELARQGRRNAGTALDNPGAAVRGHERVVTDGPYAESKDLVTGSMIFEAASLEDAIDVARSCPTYEFGGSVEVRPVQDPRI